VLSLVLLRFWMREAIQNFAKLCPAKRTIFPMAPDGYTRSQSDLQRWLALVSWATTSFQRLNVLTPKISGPFWWILGLKHVETFNYWHVGQWSKWKWCFSTSNRKILYLTMLIVCRKNLSQSGLTDCKIKTIEGKEEVFLVESLGRCQCFEIQ
jgi:hypothetical protein